MLGTWCQIAFGSQKAQTDADCGMEILVLLVASRRPEETLWGNLESSTYTAAVSPSMHPNILT